MDFLGTATSENSKDKNLPFSTYACHTCLLNIPGGSPDIPLRLGNMQRFYLQRAPVVVDLRQWQVRSAGHTLLKIALAYKSFSI